MSLRSRLIRLAHAHPEFRGELLPLIRQASTPKAAGQGFSTRADVLVREADVAQFVENSMKNTVEKVTFGRMSTRTTRGNRMSIDVPFAVDIVGSDEVVTGRVITRVDSGHTVDVNVVITLDM